jgi:hypothetical protein
MLVRLHSVGTIVLKQYLFRTQHRQAVDQPNSIANANIVLLGKRVILKGASPNMREAHAFGVKFTQSGIPARSLAARHITGASELL